MRIAQIATQSASVSEHPGPLGSVESIVWLLTRELLVLGHDVTVFATADSETEGRLHSVLGGPYGSAGSLDDWYLCEWLNLCEAVSRSDHFDVVHSHVYLWGIPLEPFARAPMLHTLHVAPDTDSNAIWSRRPGAWV
ncbi:MAG: glycosyltransferase, partial [Actinobacteria bacterium]|nr:glycosyltransferase [Actinomycetota bacterium]